MQRRKERISRQNTKKGSHAKAQRRKGFRCLRVVVYRRKGRTQPRALVRE